ncbi:hypothetical protein BZA77DRAFT_63492 [Pyronema omphalodes]|nr:hypothetical protein BZA77DRAFT_63492 [Pyronema omphalodes]
MPAFQSPLARSDTSSYRGLQDMTDVDRSLAMPPCDGYCDAENTFRTEACSSKQVGASSPNHHKEIVPTMTAATTTTTSQRFLASTIDRHQKRVGQPSRRRNIDLPAELLFEIFDYCTDGTLLNVSRTCKSYNDMVQPMMINRALEIPYDEDFAMKYPELNLHDRRCPFICAIINKNDRLLNILIKNEYFPMDGLFYPDMGLAVTPLHWAIGRAEYREQQFIGVIQKLLEIGFRPNTYDQSGLAPLHILLWEKSVGVQESKMWYIPIIDLLWQYGADLNHPIKWDTSWGTKHTPLALARSCHQEQSIIDTLLLYGATA